MFVSFSINLSMYFINLSPSSSIELQPYEMGLYRVLVYVCVCLFIQKKERDEFAYFGSSISHSLQSINYSYNFFSFFLIWPQITNINDIEINISSFHPSINRFKFYILFSFYCCFWLLICLCCFLYQCLIFVMVVVL